MSKQFRAWKIDDVQLLPASVQDYVPADHLSRLIVSLVRESLDLTAIVGGYSTTLVGFVRMMMAEGTHNPLLKKRV